jgi:hypothetical protein
MRKKTLLSGICLLLLAALGACSPAQLAPTATLLPSTATFTTSPTATETPPPTATVTPTPTATVTPVPTYVVLRGNVTQHVGCYYGPSKAYLYKYGVLVGNHLDIIGYIADTGYIEVQAIGGNNPCWMSLEFMDVEGDVNTVQPVDPLTIKMPWSPYYNALKWVKAERSGDEVTVTWSTLTLRAGDDSEQEPYLLEAWVCRSGRLTFVPVGTYETTATIVDEPGCSEPSFGRVYGVEKHGYTKYLKIQWPQAQP